MPYKRKVTSKPRRKYYRKRRRYIRNYRKRQNNNISTMVVRGTSVIPDRLFVKLKYSVVTTFNTTGVNAFVMRGNSLFDPELTGAGHQPRGFDQWSVLYSRYKVHKSSIQVMAVNNDSDINYVAVVPGIETVLNYANPQDITEHPYVKYRYLAPGANGPSQASLWNSQTTKSIRGEKILDDDYSALINANPAKQWYWHVLCSAANEAIAPLCTCQINIVYYAEFYRRLSLPRST